MPSTNVEQPRISNDAEQENKETQQNNDKPVFNDQGFDAGVGITEDEDPKKYLEKITGKLAQTLRKYSKDNGANFELEKYILNSVISATHTSQMEEEDRNKIIDKIDKAGNASEKDVQQEPEVEKTEEPVETNQSV